MLRCYFSMVDHIKKKFATPCLMLFLTLGIFSSYGNTITTQHNLGYEDLKKSFFLQYPQPGTVPVYEFFSFQCSHCYTFYKDFLSQWKKTVPNQVDVIMVPVIFFPRDELYARLFYALQELDLFDQAFPLFFALVQQSLIQKRLPPEIKDQEHMIRYIENKFKMSNSKVKAAFVSTTVEQSLKDAKTLLHNTGITLIPALLVNGRYLVNGQTADTDKFEPVLEVVNTLIKAQGQGHTASP